LLILIILFACLFAFESDIWMSGFLLYLSLNLSVFQKTINHIVPMLDNSQKTSARSLLSTMTIWDTQKLSVLGMTKLTIELLTFRFVHGWLMPLVLFFLLGGVASFLYMALVSASLAWVGNDQNGQQFNWFSNRMRDALALIPTVIMAPIFSVFKSSPGWLSRFKVNHKAWQQGGWSRIELLWLSVLSAGCKSELAGPLMLDEVKLARPKLNADKGVETAHIEIATNWILRFKCFTLILLTLIFALVTTL
jgi:cobalamin biosynthesis protein CobD/CbiB